MDDISQIDDISGIFSIEDEHIDSIRVDFGRTSLEEIIEKFVQVFHD